MIVFKEKPALLQEWPIVGWDGPIPRRERMRKLKVKVNLAFDANSAEAVNNLVEAFQTLFQEEGVIGPDGKPMKLGVFGNLELGPPLLFGARDVPSQTHDKNIGEPLVHNVPDTTEIDPPGRPNMENYDPFENPKKVAERMRESIGPGRLRYWSFKFFGALFMRDKGTNGKPNMAISNHKTIGMVLFVMAVTIWLFGGTWLDEEQTMKLLESGMELPSKWGAPPDALVYSFWAALGLKGALDVVGKFRR